MRELESLTPRELAFCQLYTCLGSETCSNATASAKSAGYSVERNAGWRLMQREVIRQKIADLHGERMDRIGLSADKVLSDLEHTRILALAKSDLAVAARCSELHGKYLAMFADRVAVSMEPARLPEEIRIEAKRIAILALQQGQVLPVLDVQVQEPQPAADGGQGETEDERATSTDTE